MNTSKSKDKRTTSTVLPKAKKSSFRNRYNAAMVILSDITKAEIDAMSAATDRVLKQKQKA
ncbi:hypothetical protein [Chitinophaga qingshengii]|uniref:Uncharacterized protein n=1 Tax=Chitinophaga qingshengii TaxID=1569794 RepID=A0ABR7TJ75_9BACT|nr:hypothetical protein [Chitinophaga qingshengii]MBC9930018.1 hypothetical protein [Chitinophaga qingshengii]